MSSISKACIEIGNSIKGLRLSRSQSTDSGGIRAEISGLRAPANMSSTLCRAFKSATSGVKVLQQQRNGNMATARRVPQINPWQDINFLQKFFWYFTFRERCILAQVCRQWKDVLYHPVYWQQVTAVLSCREHPQENETRIRFYQSLQYRGCDSLCMVGALDSDIEDLVNNYPSLRKSLRCIHFQSSNISDSGLELLMERMLCVSRLELSGCNELSEAAFWSSLNCKINHLTVTDCINVADDSVGAIAQLLPALSELNLQAYHVTDTSLSFFSAKQSCTLSILRLQSCWEVTNHGIVNVVHSLPNLTVLSLSGCNKISDDGVELVAENLRKLKSLDLSWCPRITDAALEYIACDLAQLEQLTLDRCPQISDIGVGYLSTMTCLARLFLRWCSQVRDFGLQHLYTMKSLRVLSVAGCNLLTPSGLTGLIQLSSLEELELTNCTGLTQQVLIYLWKNMPQCLVIN